MRNLYRLRALDRKTAQLDAKRRIVTKKIRWKKNVRNYDNYVSTSRQDGNFTCDHSCEKPHKLTHSSKRSGDYYVFIELQLCDLCYTKAFERFYAEVRCVPTLRAHGNLMRKYVIEFLHDAKEQRRWYLDPRMSYLVKNLPVSYNCNFYIDKTVEQQLISTLSRVDVVT